ncbi:adenosylcobinamide-phosphate synthase CbiB [Halalkalicoccus ordinarius]|uniref:adenosylcobinamide-phosphate synthase CbiB n=1 Tax=Halalkalicoccus ordinarius TaxID=3116651 RepID=UPI00300E7982
MASLGTTAVALAAGLEFVVGEPPERVHPVAWFGRAVAWADREWSRPRLAGGAVALVAPASAAAVAGGAVALARRRHGALGALAAGIALFSTTSLRMLLAVAREVIVESDPHLDAARGELLALAGREASGLSSEEVRSAAVESAAENLADGLVAPLGAFALLAPVSLALGAGAAAWVKAVNTLDSMLGYPSKPHGTASARLDDLVMWLPARTSALLIALAARRPAAASAAGRWASEPPSPNSGWPMATLAAVLDARLEKPGVYALNPSADLPDVETGLCGVRIVAVAGAIAYLIAGAIAWR